MQKTFTHLRMLCLMLCIYTSTQAQVVGGRHGEVFKATTLQSPLRDPWDIAYGPDNFLWVTEAKGYRVRRIDPSTGSMSTALDIHAFSTNVEGTTGITNTEFDNIKRTFTTGEGGFAWPQGGMMGLAFHPDFNASTPKPYVYLAYVRSYVGKRSLTSTTTTFPDGQGQYFKTFLTRWTWNSALQKLTSPVILCDTIPGSNDHNSGRITIAPVNGVNYLFYALGDMGAGQFDNQSRIIRAQDPASYQGKILRFNLEEDADADQGTVDYNKWIPNDNPYGTNSAVWAIGIRNNQGFSYATIGGTGRLYGSSHGPFSDDEINILEAGKNYGHPLVIGYADGNYNGVKAGAAGGSLPTIALNNGEQNNATAIGASYRNPIYSFYDATQATVTSIYNNQTNNGAWPSEAPSGMEIYTSNAIPGWKNSILLSSLKWGRILRLKLSDNGTSIVSVDGTKDTVTYFGGQNRFRDVTYSPDGKSLFVVMDSSLTTSGPSAGNPIVTNCRGCVQKYEFIGFNNNNGKSTIPAHIPIAPGTTNTCETLSTVTINADNTNLWVPITDANSNIVAEIRANGNNIGTVSTVLYKSGSLREDGSKRLYLNRNMTISVSNSGSFTTNGGVGVRIYLTKAEFETLRDGINSAGWVSGIETTADLGIFKTLGSGCVTGMIGNAAQVAGATIEPFGTDGYVMTATITSFSAFYIANNSSLVLPIKLKDFTASWLGNNASLSWSTSSESGAEGFDIERSTDGRSFSSIGFVKANGNSNSTNAYRFNDQTISSLNGNTVYYRLKLRDVDGKYVYSSVATVTRTASPFVVKVFPNPVKGKANLSIFADRDDKVQWQLTDAGGRVLRSQSALVQKGQNNISFDMTDLPAGVYQLQAKGQYFSQVLKLQKQ